MSIQDEAGLILKLYANLEKLIDATPDGRTRTAAMREQMKAISPQLAKQAGS